MTTQTTSAPTGIDAHFYLVKDFAAGMAFYRDVLGLTPSWEIDGGGFAEFELADGSTFGIGQLPEWHAGGGVMFAVPDVDEALRRVTAGGPKQQGEIYDGPVCRMAWCADPDGNTFALHRRKQTS